METTSKTKQKRLPRYKRDPERAPNFRLQDRDIDIVKSIHDFRFLQTHHITAMIPGSDKKIKERLKNLYHHGYIERLFLPIKYDSGGSDKFIYSLDKKGVELLIDSFGVDRKDINWKRGYNKVSDIYIKHSLMVSDFGVVLWLAVRETQGLKILFWRQGKNIEIKIKKGNKELKVIPDAFFGLEDNEGRMYFFLEADRGTMRHPRFLNKMRRYWLVWKEDLHKKRFGIKYFRVLTVTNSEDRLENLVKTTMKADDEQRGSEMFCFTDENRYSIDYPTNLFGNIWQSPGLDGGKRFSILE